MNYIIYIHNGNEYLGAEGKTITVTEKAKPITIKKLAKRMFKENETIPEQLISNVLENFCKVTADIISEGKSVHLKCGNDVAIRIFGDISIDGGNINLARAQQLIPGTTDITVENAAGLKVRIKAEAQKKFSEMLPEDREELELSLVKIVELEKIVRKDSTTEEVVVDSSSNATTNDYSTNEGME